MARIDVPEGDGREASRIWQLAPHLPSSSVLEGICIVAP
jgi:hypothetical protein